MNEDTISRRAAIDALCELMSQWFGPNCMDERREIRMELDKLPSVQPTLYGYKIEHLAYIARVMEKKGITAEQAAGSFDDMSTAIRLFIEEITQAVDESVQKMRRKE